MACSIAIHCIMNTIVCVYFVAITFLSDVSADNPSTSAPVTLQHCQISMDCNINLAIDPLPSPMGKQGPQGEKGDKGDKGENGLKGVIGARGSVGIQGKQGFPGRPGMPGSCRCSASSSGITDNEGDGGGIVKAPLGSKSNPVSSCKFLPESYKTGIYWINENKPFLVKCDLERNLTCIYVNAETPKVTHRNKTFWLSEVGIRIADFFNGVSLKNLRWLRTQSLFTIQSLRYHCSNSYVYSKDDDDHNLLVMNLKGKIMGPKPSERNPFFYYVTADTDGCKDFKYSNKGEWQYTDIELISTTQQLPVIDVNIRDIKNGEKQEFYIEHRELCFG